MAAKAKVKPEFPTYKGKPFIRFGDTIYYGSMSDEYVIKLEIKSKKDLWGLNVGDLIAIDLLSTDQDLSARKRVIKSSERNGLYSALDIAEAWLCKALSTGA